LQQRRKFYYYFFLLFKFIIIIKNKFYRQKNFENALKLSEEIVSLPIGNHLNKSDIKYVAQQISFFYKKKYKFN
jgi:dTDP-4-amino-4,6-dideoxygalactose transaminase